MTNNNEYLKKIGMEVKIARIRKGYTMPQLAKETGLSEGALSKLENGKNNFQILTLKRVSEVLGKDMNDFFVI